MDSSDSILIIIIIICITFSSYFSATETAFSSFNRIRMKNLADKGNKKAKQALALQENYDVLISTILIGNNIVNILSASLATLVFVRYLGNETGATVSTIVTTIVVLIFGEITPKTIAKEHPESFAMFSTPFLSLLIKLLLPLNLFFKLWKIILSKIVKSNEHTGITEEELLTIVDEVQQTGGINEHESTLIRSVIEFADVSVEEIYTPRIDIVCVDVTMDRSKIGEIFKESGYSRLPVYEGDIENIIGVINNKDFYNHLDDEVFNIEEIIKPALFITVHKKLDELLKELQSQKIHMAIILDEFGGTAGLITLEDLLEALVGEIWDEHDEVIEDIKVISENEYIILGNTNIDDFFDYFKIKDETESVTVNGWIVQKIGMIPNENEVYNIDNFTLEILKMNQRRIEEFKLIVNEIKDKGNE